jgi:hypothetical protein
MASAASAAGASAARQCIGIKNGVQCTKPVVSLSTRYCAEHKHRCSTLYARYKTVCSGTLDFANDLDVDFTTMTLAQLVEFVRVMTRRFSQQSTCITFRRKHNDTCINEAARDSGHKHHVNELTQIARLYEKSLEEAYQRIAWLKQQQQQQEEGDDEVSTNANKSRRQLDYDLEELRRPAASSSMQTEAVKQQQERKDAEEEAELIRAMSDSKKHAFREKRRKELLLSDLDVMIAARLGPLVPQYDVMDDIVLFTAWGEQWSQSQAVPNSTMARYVAKLTKTPRSKVQETAYADAFRDTRSVIRQLNHAWAHCVLQGWMYPIDYFNYFCSTSGCMSFLVFLLSQPVFSFDMALLMIEMTFEMIETQEFVDHVVQECNKQRRVVFSNPQRQQPYIEIDNEFKPPKKGQKIKQAKRDVSSTRFVVNMQELRPFASKGFGDLRDKMRYQPIPREDNDVLRRKMNLEAGLPFPREEALEKLRSAWQNSKIELPPMTVLPLKGISLESARSMLTE